MEENEKNVTIWVRVTESFLEKVRDAARRRGMNLSEFVRHALVVYFDNFPEVSPSEETMSNNGGEN